MSKFITGRGPHAVAICEALGVDPKTCTAIEFRMSVEEVVSIKVERHVYDREARALAVSFGMYNLVPDINEWARSNGWLAAAKTAAEFHIGDPAWFISNFRYALPKRPTKAGSVPSAWAPLFADRYERR